MTDVSEIIECKDGRFIFLIKKGIQERLCYNNDQEKRERERKVISTPDFLRHTIYVPIYSVIIQSCRKLYNNR